MRCELARKITMEDCGWRRDGQKSSEVAPAQRLRSPAGSLRKNSGVGSMSKGQFARVVKGVDVRSTERKCARVRAPQLTKQSFDLWAVTRPGLEPGISGSGGRRLVHQANGPCDLCLHRLGSAFGKAGLSEARSKLAAPNTSSQSHVFKHPWPNGQGVELLIRRLRARVPQGLL